MKNARRIIACFLVVGAAAAAAAFFLPSGARAQGAGYPVYDSASDLRDKMDEVKAKNMEKLSNSWDYAITMALTQAINTTAQRVAQTTATWVASGSWGQGPLLFTQEFGSYGRGIFLDTASEALNTFSKTAFGFGICEPLDARVSLRIKLGVARVYAPKPTCSFQQFQKAYEGTWNNIESGKLLQNLTASVEMGQSPLSFALNTQFSIADKAAGNKADKIAKYLSSDGFKDLVQPISGNTKTPAEIIKTNTENDVIFSPRTHEIETEGAVLNHVDMLKDVGANAGRIFLSTLTSKILDKYLKKGMVSVFDAACSLSSGAAFDLCKNKVNEQLAAGTSSGNLSTSLASAYFASVFAPTVTVVDDFSPAGDLVACPGKDLRGVWNCAIDQGFNSALQPQGSGGYLSVRDALSRGFLHGDYELIGPRDKRNSDWNCYTEGYCYSNLLKLRRLRIIPVGWEMAAKASDENNDHITLAGAIAKFDDKNSPYYHLIDQDWVLKLPITQCRAQVSGQTLASANTKDRADVCVDEPSCISEDADGKCTGGFGYCTREHNSWQIDATACPAQYASCNTFSNPSGKELSVLTNTVDAAMCNAGNAGCRPYVSVASADGNWAEGSQSVYLNAKAMECDSSGAGCRSLLQMKTASTANIIPNSGFETPNTDGLMAAGWTKDWEGVAGNASQYLRDGISAFEGIASYLNAGALSLGGYHNLNGTVDIGIEPNQLYTFSFYAKSAGAGSPNGSLEIKLFDRPFIGPADKTCPAYAGIDDAPKPTCVQDLSLAAYQPTCSTTAAVGFSSCATAPGGDYGPKNPHGEIKVGFPLTPGYERYTVTFASPDNAHYIGIYMPLVGAPYYIDAVQLEKGPTATVYHPGGSDVAGTSVALKAPPEYLGCTGEDSQDAGKSCGSYARVCRQSEVGCDRYTPQQGGNVPITAVASTNDACDARCVGYSTFKQEATRWMPAVFPLYFIPSTAKSCQLSEVGCDEFTNLQAAASGGEKKEYYTYVRACRQPDAASDGNFFTWEGSDTSGFQLKSYTLRVKDDGTGSLATVANQSSGAASDNYIHNPSAPENSNGPVYVQGTDLGACNKGVYAAKSNPDCREFLDADGNVFYRLLSATVTSTSDCITYRKTVIADQASCVNSGGLWDDAAKSCDYYVLPSQSLACGASANACRAYTGNQGSNAQTILTSTFDNNQSDGWNGGVISNESTVVGGQSYAAVSMSKALKGDNGTSLLKRGRSYMLTLWAKGSGSLNAYFQGTNITPASGRPQYFADAAGASPIRLTTEWQRYVLGPVVMDWNSSDSDTLAIAAAGATTQAYFDNVELSETQDMFALIANSWKTPTVCDQTSAGQSLPQAQLGCSNYENKAGETVTLKSFDHLCREQAVGCEAFTDTQGTETPFASYHNAVCTIGGATNASSARDCVWRGQTVCSVDAGQTSCRFDFDGSTDQLAASGNFSYAVSADTLAIPADKTVYLINDGSDNAVCDAASVGCTAFGDNDLNTTAVCNLGAGSGVRACPAGAVGSSVKCYVAVGQTNCTYRVPTKVNSKTVYRIIDPAKVDSQLCTADAVSCQAWTAGDGTKKFFKDPGAALCEYKDQGQYNGTDVSGWFKKGTAEPCDPTFVISGSNLGIRKNLDQQFAPQSLAGICPNENALCTEFTDHSDRGKAFTVNGKTSYEFAQGRPFYYINDSRIKDASAACNSQVSQKQGCLALDRTDDPRKTMNTSASYALSDSQNFKMVTPVSDGNNDANIILKVTKDRVCSEWLECNTEQMVNDTASGRRTSRCLSLGSCIKKGSDGRCITWGNLGDDTGVLNNVVYRDRVVNSSGNDYSGFAIPGLPPVSQLVQVKVGQVSDPNVSTNEVGDLSNQTYAPIYGLKYKVDGSTIVDHQSCKIYPEADAPFPKSVLNDPTGSITGSRKNGFANVNVCEMKTDDNVGINTKSIGLDCECSYRKATYSTLITKYYPLTAETGTRPDGTTGEIKGAICSGGTYNGRECWTYATGKRCESSNSSICGAVNLSCSVGSGLNTTSDGTCVPLDKADSVLGETGYCLETDDTLKVNGTNQSACITWLPIDSAKGRDTANQFVSAAFIPKIGEERYCAAPAKYCIARDCQSLPIENPLCTHLKNIKIDYAPAAADQFPENKGQATIQNPRNGNCFDACNIGADDKHLNSECVEKEKQCGAIVKTFCEDHGYDDTLQTRACINTCNTMVISTCGNPADEQYQGCIETTRNNCRVDCRNLNGLPATECETDIMATDGSCKKVDATTGAVSFNTDSGDCLDKRASCVAGGRTIYCLGVMRKDTACFGFDPATNANQYQYCNDIYNTCLQTTSDAYTLCKNLEKNSCLGDDYGLNAQCSHDLPGIYRADSFAAYDNNPLYNVSAYCGVDGYTKAGPRYISLAKGGMDLASCATTGTQFCGDGTACRAGTSCAAVNDLSIYQTEYTREEQFESYGAWVHAQDQHKFTSFLDYPMIAPFGGHTPLGGVSESTIPVATSNTLRFSLDEASGDWINVYNVNDKDQNPVKSSNARNIAPETKTQAPIIGSYPLDVIGLYYAGKPSGSGTGTVTYKLETPSLLLLSQIDRVNLKILSNGQNGLCRYSTAPTASSWNNWGNNGDMFDVCGKSLFGRTGSNNHYGYEPANVSSSDDQNYTPNRWGSYVALTAANNWSYQLASNEGSTTVTLLTSDTEPKRVTGLRVELEDNSNRGYTYIAGLDVHMRGPVCGAATFVGSSNPSAPPSLWPVVYADSVNSSGDFGSYNLNSANGTGRIIWGTACKPWGAFSASNPQEYVTDSQASPPSGACEIDKGGIAASPVEQKKIFAGVISTKLFNEGAGMGRLFDFTGDNLRNTPWSPVIPANSEPKIGTVKLNGNAGGAGAANAVTGSGSLRVSMSFSAVANTNHMPIRSVRINWGDGTDDIDPGFGNYYKNHTASGNCPDNAFSGTSGACDSSAFEYTHVYSCTTPNAKATADFLEIGIKNGDDICLYAPTISVTDNWKATGATDPGSMIKVIIAPPKP